MNPSHFSADCIEFISLLNKYDVKFVIVGGEAVIYHGYVRLTGDVDFLYNRNKENSKSLLKALDEFWAGDIPGGITLNDLQAKGYFIQFGVPPNRIDLMNQIDGVTFDEVWENKIIEELQFENKNLTIYYIGLSELIKNKISSNRPKDQEDLIYLKSRLS